MALVVVVDELDLVAAVAEMALVTTVTRMTPVVCGYRGVAGC